ncbi:MAG TPA: FKBP-type peptidyl-prolyl cis-trans isomerase [Ignavibacteriaceae bacterium]|nr:FKBP-type peptidyl-prolyl cis-trans isomerase [Ignavibacteriaceae bacterium]
MKYISIILFALLIIAGCTKSPDTIQKDSGLIYVDDTLGTGDTAKIGDLVSFHFEAWKILDSTDIFTDWSKDSTRKSSSLGGTRMMGRPMKYLLGSGKFVPGIDEGIEGMKTGGTRTIIIPASLAYKDKGAGPIPPNTSLKIQITLLSTKEGIVAKRWDVDSTKFKTTKDGLKYQILEEGTGEKLDSGDVVTIHYTGYLLDGTKFDSSVERDEPLKFRYKIQSFIKGFQEGLGLMKKRTKAELIVPPNLGYGDKSLGKIKPNSTLIFDIEILDVKKQ